MIIIISIYRLLCNLKHKHVIRQFHFLISDRSNFGDKWNDNRYLQIDSGRKIWFLCGANTRTPEISRIEFEKFCRFRDK